MSDDAISPPSGGAARILVPAYFHPAVEPDAWAALRRAARRLTAVVLNPASGPGDAPDPAYTQVRAGLRETRVLGYVDTDYGRRPHGEVVAEIERHRAWYDVDGVFLDQTLAGPDGVAYYARLGVAARSLGAGFVALNPGTRVHWAYHDLADLVVTFEGSWDTYRGLPGQDGDIAPFDPDRDCHLVHAAPPDAPVHGYATPGTLPNPWAVLGPLGER
ncbi:spherulation-specific family 4 protein [Streptacidiphilus fuscans]|uniref:spherulation-specific family 4 protein n=1 Tax=Streptacidiphilus fuscans TaxID=2789292 RepID=UPI002E2B594F|nr:spherulation-specific family 4 protein [Streptacidiphilus fuscans]